MALSWLDLHKITTVSWYSQDKIVDWRPIWTPQGQHHKPYKMNITQHHSPNKHNKMNITNTITHMNIKRGAPWTTQLQLKYEYDNLKATIPIQIPAAPQKP